MLYLKIVNILLKTNKYILYTSKLSKELKKNTLSRSSGSFGIDQKQYYDCFDL